MSFQNCESSIILLRDFNARTGLGIDSVGFDSEYIKIAHRCNSDKIINTNIRLLLYLCDLCKTTGMSIVNGRVGSDKGIVEFTCKRTTAKISSTTS